MSREANKLFGRRYIEEVANTGNMDALPRFVSTDGGEVYDNPRHAAGLEGARQHIMGVRETYPDLHLTLEQLR